MTMSRIISSLFITLPLLTLGACDLDDHDGFDELEVELEPEFDLEIPDADAPASAEPAGVAAGEQPEQQTTASVFGWTAYASLAALGQDDIVQLHSRQKGFIGCPTLTDISATPAPASQSQGYVWRVNVVDIDFDGQLERQFEALDTNGNPTGLYLKMDGNDDLMCEVITGIGDAAAWTSPGYYNATTSNRTIKYGQLRSLKYDHCIQVGGNAPVGAVCSASYGAFSFLVLD